MCISGTRYRIDSSKIKSIRVAANTQAAVAGDIKAMGELAADVGKEGALYFLVAGTMDIIHYYSDKNEDFCALLGHLGVDMAIGLPVVLLGIAAAATFFGLPAILVVAVGLGVSWGVSVILTKTDEKYHWSEKLGNKVRQGEQFIQHSPYLKQLQKSNASFMGDLLHPADNENLQPN